MLRLGGGIGLEELFEAIRTAECIEIYSEDKYGASVLLFGLTLKERPLHILVTVFERPLCKVITAYEPNPEEWEHRNHQLCRIFLPSYAFRSVERLIQLIQNPHADRMVNIFQVVEQ